MGWECSSEQSAYLALQEPQFQFDKLSKKSKQKTKGHTTKKAFTKKQISKKYYAILSYLVSQMFPFNIPLIKVSLKYVGEKKKEKKNQTIHLGGRGKQNSELEARLAFTVSSRPARATQLGQQTKRQLKFINLR